jgi:hypothetical protein
LTFPLCEKHFLPFDQRISLATLLEDIRRSHVLATRDSAFFSPEARLIAEAFGKKSKAKKMVISGDHSEITAARSQDG